MRPPLPPLVGRVFSFAYFESTRMHFTYVLLVLGIWRYLSFHR
jgi:hypothetical protein